MAKYNVVITKTAFRQLRKLPGQVATRLENKMLDLENNPRPNGCIKLKGRPGYRIRVGDYRIVYSIDDQLLTIAVLLTGHRRDVYD